MLNLADTTVYFWLITTIQLTSEHLKSHWNILLVHPQMQKVRHQHSSSNLGHCNKLQSGKWADEIPLSEWLIVQCSHLQYFGSCVVSCGTATFEYMNYSLLFFGVYSYGVYHL